MSRIGVMKIKVPEGVTVSLVDNVVNVKGPKGELNMKLDSNVSLVIEKNEVNVKRLNEELHSKSMHGTTRSIINNMMKGVVDGYSIELEMVGIGYRAIKEGDNISMNIGYTHPVVVKPIEGVNLEVVDQTKIIVSGIDKQIVGNMAAKIRSLKKPEPYKGKGIRYKGEIVKKKTPRTTSV